MWLNLCNNNNIFIIVCMLYYFTLYRFVKLLKGDIEYPQTILPIIYLGKNNKLVREN